MTLPVDGIKLHRGNFAAIGQQIQPLLDAGQCFRLQVKPWREKRSLSQNALSHMWYTEISEYLIARGKTFATPEWVSGRRVPGSGFCVWRSDSNRYLGSALASCLPCRITG